MKRVALFIVVFSLFFAKTTFASYAVVNSDNGAILIGSNAHEPLPVASLTKIWTAYIVVKNSDLNEQVIVSKEAAHMEGSSIYLQQGQKISVETLLYGLLLRSGNDAATALAEHVGGSVEGFVQLMNEEADRQGLVSSHFKNPSGLHDDEHLISAYDMAQMLNIAMQHPVFAKIASSTYYSNGEVHWQNKHRLVGKGEALSGKTGYTKVAGRTLATFYKYPDRSFAVVTINASDDWNLHGQLANEVMQEFAWQEVVGKGRYNVAGEKFIVEQPITALVKKNEHIKHMIKLSRLNSDEALWYVMQNDEILQIERIKRK